MKKSLFITFFHCFVCILSSGLGTWSLAPVARSSRAFCHIDFLSHLWWEILGTWMRNWATSCLGWVTSTTNKWNNCNRSCRSSQQTCLYDSLRSVPAFSLVLPQIHGHLCREGFDSCRSHVATLQHCTNWYHDQLPPVCSEWYGGVFNLFLTSCRSFSSGMSTPRWWATGEQWAHTLPNDLLGNLCTWARVVLLGDESRWLQMHGIFGSQFCQP